ncbi:MAG: hypothetical protein EAZ24_10955 [Burkholderiales bacterium]|nr:MAG: hypothetical protein EAZ24_10955 [Burkholderiales bacterium]TAG78617.1 MAG: hypothetical protein EAZ21_12330 [Betaproteobacteria bacterium]
MLLGGCAALANLRDSGLRGLRCTAIKNLEQLGDRNLIVFGELHGTNEVPKFLADVACNFAANKRIVVVALELPFNAQRIASDIVSGDASVDMTTFAEHAYWARSKADGRSSEAMWRLLLALREINAIKGKTITVRFFDVGFPDLNQSGEPREQRMADNLRAIVKDAPAESVTLALTGNVHSLPEAGAPWDASFASMTYRLRDLRPLSLDLSHDGGDAWFCAIDKCGQRSLLPSWDSVGPSQEPRILMGKGAHNHHGVYHVGKISASPPLIPW